MTPCALEGGNPTRPESDVKLAGCSNFSSEGLIAHGLMMRSTFGCLGSEQDSDAPSHPHSAVRTLARSDINGILFVIGVLVMPPQSNKAAIRKA
jgi:hypothetical protein